MIRAAALALVLVAAVVAPALAGERTSPPAIGELAPDLHLRDQNKRSFVLRDVLKEREFVILAFYPKAFTSG